ncbi:MAG: hypothetical protein M3O99_12500, partial [Chloroflexota bacterium]|nr:hypothetical protein [Chloroflexota bacterium]
AKPSSRVRFPPSPLARVFASSGQKSPCIASLVVALVMTNSSVAGLLDPRRFCPGLETKLVPLFLLVVTRGVWAAREFVTAPEGPAAVVRLLVRTSPLTRP